MYYFSVFVLPGIPGPPPAQPVPFIADHPILFYIKLKHAIVFAGRFIQA